MKTVETKEVILQTARDEFMEKGFQEASMRKIAGKVGITATALYRHYANKEDIFEAIVEPAVTGWESICKTEEKRQVGMAHEYGIDDMWQDTKQPKGYEIRKNGSLLAKRWEYLSFHQLNRQRRFNRRQYRLLSPNTLHA